jgi:hypothetical protein
LPFLEKIDPTLILRSADRASRRRVQFAPSFAPPETPFDTAAAPPAQDEGLAYLLKAKILH